MLRLSSANKYIFIDSFHLAEGICQQDPCLYVASLPINPLIKNILLDKTIGICIENFYNVVIRIYLKSLRISFKICFSRLTWNIITRRRLVMQSPLCSAIAKSFVYSFENRRTQDLSFKFLTKHLPKTEA